jgi:hypothetical protein
VVFLVLGLVVAAPFSAAATGQMNATSPGVSETVDADTRKALEEMEEALMDQIQREDMQAAQIAGEENASLPKAPPPSVVSGNREEESSTEPGKTPVMKTERDSRSRKVPGPAAPRPNVTPSQEETAATPIYIRDAGVDQAGIRLGFFTRETISASSQFTLSNRNERKIVIRIDSRPEFPSRPGLSSIYAATWILVEDENTVPYYLATRVGQVSPDSARSEAERIVSRTARILETFAYLFE